MTEPSNAKAESRRQFGANAANYATSAPHAKGGSLQRLVELLAPGPEQRVLDVATGAGHTALALAPFAAEVVATDLTEEMLEVAAGLAAERGLTNVRFQLADAEDLPFPDASFDLVTCRIAPHHFPDVPRFVAESARVLRPGGRLAVVDNVVPDEPRAAAFVNGFERYRDPSHVRCLSLSEWEADFEAAGLRVSHREVADKPMRFSGWVANMSVPDERAAELRAMLRSAPPEAQAFLLPAFSEEDASFRLAEALLIGDKPAA